MLKSPKSSYSYAAENYGGDAGGEVGREEEREDEGPSPPPREASGFRAEECWLFQRKFGDWKKDGAALLLSATPGECMIIQGSGWLAKKDEQYAHRLRRQ